MIADKIYSLSSDSILNTTLKKVLFSAVLFFIFSTLPARAGEIESIDDLEADAMENGDIKLEWTSPEEIDDGYYRIRWSTYSEVDWDENWGEDEEGEWGDYDNKYSISFSTDTAQDDDHSYIIDNLCGGVEYYFAVWTGDGEDWSDISNISTATVIRVTELHIEKSDTIDFGDLELQQSTVTTQAVKVQNTGNVPLDFSIKGSTITENTPWVFAAESGWDEFVLKGAFHDEAPGEEGFSGSEHDNVIYSYYIPCAEDNYTINGDQTGVEVAKGQEIDFWIYFIMPSQTTTKEQQEMTITIGAQESE